MDYLSSDVFNIILEYINIYDDLINIKHVNKYYNDFINNYYNGVLYINDIHDYYNYILYTNEVTNYRYKYFNNIILITSLNQLKTLKLDKITYLNLSNINSVELINENYLYYNTFLHNCINLKYLDIYGLEFNLPQTLIKLEHLELYECTIKYIPSNLINLKYLYAISDFTDGELSVIPKNIMLNLEYINIKNCFLKHDIYISEKNIKYGLFGINYKNNYRDRLNNINIYLIDSHNKKINLNNYINHEFYHIEYNAKKHN